MPFTITYPISRWFAVLDTLYDVRETDLASHILDAVGSVETSDYSADFQLAIPFNDAQRVILDEHNLRDI